MNPIIQNADEILATMTRMWPQPARRTSLARKFAVDRDILSPESARTAYPMSISQALASKGWTAESFVRALY
jgi:hypothetical protein